jgi:hypothetical protein
VPEQNDLLVVGQGIDRLHDLRRTQVGEGAARKCEVIDRPTMVG